LAGCAPVPQAFIRGLKADKDSELGAARFVGVGASVVEGRASTAVHVYLQELDNGHIVTVTREFNEPEAAARKSFHQLAQTVAVKDASLASLAAGQLVTQGGKRTAAGRLVIGRARAVVNPQNFAWEQLKAPLLAEDFDEISSRLDLLPPACFRPRRAGGDFHVCPVKGIENARFDPRSNAVTATLVDASGCRAGLWHPWSTRGRIGAEAMLAALQGAERPMFVAGHVHRTGGGLVIHPAAIVFAGEGNARRVVLPWIHSGCADSAFTPPAGVSIGTSPRSLYAPVTELAGDLLLQGGRRLAQRGWPGWDRGMRELEEQGCHRVVERIRDVQREPARALFLLKLWRLSMNQG
jgi:hypothetical protein